MRLSRGRLFLRVVLLLVGGGFMAWRALEAWRAAAGQSGSGRVLAERLAAVVALVGLLAILTAATVAWQMRPGRARARPMLRLGEAGGAGPETPAAPGPDGVSDRRPAARPPSGGPSAGPGAPT